MTSRKLKRCTVTVGDPWTMGRDGLKPPSPPLPGDLKARSRIVQCGATSYTIHYDNQTPLGGVSLR